MKETPAGFAPYPRFDFFEPGEKTALVCLDVPEMQRLVIADLDQLGYKIHTGLFLDDSILKLKTHAYDVVVTSEFFQSSRLENHPILVEAAVTLPGQRRKQTYVLIGASLQTNDELQAFAHNVDAVVALEDVVNFKPVLRRAVAATAEFYGPLQETIAMMNAEDPARRYTTGGR